MKLRFLIVIIGALLSLNGWAQNDSLLSHSVFVGLRDNKYGYIGYQSRNWSVGLENTMFIRGFDEQYIRANGGFRQGLGVWGINFTADAFVGANYKGRFYDCGLKVALEKPIGRFSIGVGVMPIYDSGFGYNTCYSVNMACRIIQEASIVVDITNIPEYRMTEHRIVPGLLFQARKLWVRPELSIPLTDNIRFTRVLVSFRYDFLLK